MLPSIVGNMRNSSEELFVFSNELGRVSDKCVFKKNDKLHTLKLTDRQSQKIY